MSDKLVAKVKSLNDARGFGLAKCEIEGRKVDIRFPLKNERGKPFAQDLRMGAYLVFEMRDLEKWLSNDFQAATYRKARPEEVAMAERPDIPNQDNQKDSIDSGNTSESPSDRFIYPFNFVRPAVPLSKKKRAEALHDRFYSERYSGSITCVMETKSPLFVPDPEGWIPHYLDGHTGENERIHWVKPFFRLPGDGSFAIPGSTLKGMIRTVAEAASNSCFSVFDDTRFAYRLTEKIPPRLPGKVLLSEKKIEEMCIARIGREALSQMGMKELSVASNDNKVEFKYIDLFRRGEPEVVWAKHGNSEWPANIGTTEGKGKVTKENSHYFVVDAKNPKKKYRLPKGFKGYVGNNVEFKAVELPRSSRGATWYVSEINGKSTLSDPIDGWVKWADRGDKSSKETHQVFYEKRHRRNTALKPR